MRTTAPTVSVKRSGPLLVAALLGVALIAGCNSNKKDQASAQTAGKTTVPAPTAPATTKYHPRIVPATFTNEVTNPYFALTPGAVVVMKGTKDGVPQTHTTHITTKVKRIMGVPCVVIKDVVTEPTGVVEIAYDWYSQDQQGNVWYFGESTSDYQNGVVTSTKGSWEAGVDGAKPGIIMHASPKPGPEYYQEFRPGIAEDKGKVLGIHETVKTPKRTYRDAVRIRDTNPLDPSLVAHKWYVRGVGLVKSARVGSSHTEDSTLASIR